MITLIGNLKGGCGKSTVTFNLAVWLAKRKRQVVTFDLDPQATLSDVVDVRREEGVTPAITVFRPESDPGKVFKEHSAGEVLVDVGASNLWAMRQAIAMADRVLIPVPPSQADVWSTQRFLNIVEETVAGKKRPETLVFVNRADTHPGLTESDETEQALAALSGVAILDARISQRTIYRRSFSEGRAVFELSPSSKAAEEFINLAKALYPDLAQPAKSGNKKK
ncbi:MAG: ParA family protein [Magnetococcales bacterium]|nr:ParA family protein [Magnetococcales bacterium]